ncbi:hypothetical protein AN958_10748 [Leucoagaricus sp. SymC.cos]|nr:hypothetical protein AN958_10748 [Leucoagaricus sp. SymC.cos]
MTGPVPTLGNTFGAVEIGTIVAVYLFGMITVQSEFYFREFREDKLGLKCAVAVIWFLELGHTIGFTVETYRSSIVYASHPQDYSSFKGIGVALLLGGIITMLVQCFFSLRTWRLLPNPYRFIGLLCIIASVARCGFSTWLASIALSAQSVATYLNNQKWLITMLLSFGAALDVVVTFAMMYFFLTKRKSALQTTSRMIDRLIGFTVRTGLLTSLTAIGSLIAVCVFSRVFSSRTDFF